MIRYLLILMILCIAFSGCTTYKPFATSMEDIDPSGTGYERVTKPYYKKRASIYGTVMNVSFIGIGAGGGAYYASTLSNANSGTTAAFAVGGAAAGYLVSRLFMLHSHKRFYIEPKEIPKGYEEWVKKYDKKKKKDYLFINDPNSYNDNSMMLIPKQKETTFKPHNLYDLKVFSTVFPKSIYTDSVIISVTPLLSSTELDTVISLYPDNGGVLATKVEYVSRYKTESDFRNALDKYKEAQNSDTIQVLYSGLVQTYPFAKDFIIRYPRSFYFDDIYQRIYSSLSWSQLTILTDLYPAIPDAKAIHARTEYFEMAATFHDLHNAVTKYPQAPYIVKPYDNLNTTDSAKNVFDRLTAYKPISPVNNLPKVLSNLPEEFLIIQNHQTNVEEIDTLYNLANVAWVQTDSAADVIDSICSNYAKYKAQDQFIGTHLADNYDSGRFYSHDGSALKGKMKDRKDIIDFGEKIYSNGRKEIGTFVEGNLSGRGKIILPNATAIEEGNFKDGRLEGTGKITHTTYIDSGIFHNEKLDNQGMRTYNNGNQYTGNFLDAKFSGYGTFTWGGSKKSFKGTFADGKREGTGELDFDNGYVVSGTWKNDYPEGDITIEKVIGRNSVEWSTTWTIKNGMITAKKDANITMPFSDAEILGKLPEE